MSRLPVLAMTASLLVLGGCGRLFPAVDSSLSNAPAAVRERPLLPGCGSETVRATADANLDGRNCLWAAYLARRPAEFITTQWTIEGDPITSVYRILADGAVEVFIDSTHDAWSSRSWLRLACEEFVLIDGAPGQPAFGPAEGCLETTIR
jgi:hypothetical protein